jgi:protein-disulfide isomerase
MTQMTAKRRGFAALSLGLAVVAAPVAAFDVGAMTDAEREAFRGEIRSYLMENPEVLMEAIGVLEQRQANQQATADADLIASLADQIFDDGVSWEGGNPDGDITLVEFMDYRCSYCRRAHDEVNQLVEMDGNIRYVVKEFPILGPDSLASSRFAIATRNVAGQDAYETVHNALITMRGAVNDESLARIAEEAGLDPAPILAAMESEAVTEELRANRALAEQLAINGTPTFVLETEMLRGYVPLDQMLMIVDSARGEG